MLAYVVEVSICLSYNQWPWKTYLVTKQYIWYALNIPSTKLKEHTCLLTYSGIEYLPFLWPMAMKEILSCYTIHLIHSQYSIEEIKRTHVLAYVVEVSICLSYDQCTKLESAFFIGGGGERAYFAIYFKNGIKYN